MSDPAIGDCIIAGIASGDGPLDQMSEIVTHLERAGFVIGPMEKLKALVDEQAEDEGLWFLNPLCSEAYLQAALRRLHAEIETMYRVTNGTCETPHGN